jgi:cell division protein FtsW (lipid II flippase)
MQRVATLLASSAALTLVLGILIPRLAIKSGLTLTSNKTITLIPNQPLCFGVGFALALFAFLYSAMWFADWRIKTASWHFTISMIAVLRFGNSSEPARR